MRRGAVVALAIAASVCGATPVLASNGAMPSTIGSKGPVSIPVDGDAQTMFRMPSSIAWSLDHRIDLDAFLFYSQSRMSNSLNDYESESSTPGGSGGILFALGRPDGDDDPAWDTYTDARKFTFGVGVYVDMAGGSGDANEIRYTTFPDGIGLTTSITFVNASFVGAYTITDYLAVAASFHVIYASLTSKTLVGGDGTPLEGSPEVPDAVIPGHPSYADFLNLFRSDEATDPTTYFETDLVGVQFSGTLSLSLRPMPNLGIGLSWRLPSIGPPLSGKGKVDANTTVETALGGDPTLTAIFESTLTAHGGALGYTDEYDVELSGITVPQQVRLSIAWWPKLPFLDEGRLLLAAELAWIEWAEGLGEAKAELSGGKNEDLSQIIGGNSIETTLKQRWRNQWVISLYTAVAVTEALSFRLGFNHGLIPLNPRQQGGTATSGYTSTNLSFGASYRIGSWELMGLIEHAFYDSARAPKDVTELTARDSLYGSLQWTFHLGVSYRF